MYILGTNDYLKVATCVDGVVQVPESSGYPWLNALATLRFPGPHGVVEVRVLLQASPEYKHLLRVEDDFTDREVVLKGLPIPKSERSWYKKRHPVAIVNIWFDDSSMPGNGRSPVSVVRDIDLEEDPELLQFGDVTPLVRTRQDLYNRR